MKTKTEKIFILKLILKLERIFQNYIKTYTKILSQYENITDSVQHLDDSNIVRIINLDSLRIGLDII